MSEEQTPEQLAAAAAANAQSNDDSKKTPAQLVEEAITRTKAEMKALLDGAYNQRDAALKEKAELEHAKKEAEQKRMLEEGKHKEVLELQLAEEKAKREAVEKRNTELSRDVAVRSALNGLNFRNEKAATTAYNEIISNLKRDANGNWQGSDGKSIVDTVSALVADTDFNFLFKAKENGGGGSDDVGGKSKDNSSGKSLFSMSQAEVLKQAAAGKLPHQTR